MLRNIPVNLSGFRLMVTEAPTMKMRKDDEGREVASERATQVLTKEETLAVEWLAVVINTWNRIAIPSRYPVKP